MAAAYAALVSLSHILNQILHPPPTHHFLIPTEQIQSLLEQVSSFVDFLEKYSKSEEFTDDLEERIVGAAHRAEDIIESYVVTQIREKYKVHPQRKSSAPFLRRIQKEMRELLPIHKGLKEKAIVEVISEFVSIQEDLDEIRRRRGMEDVTTEYFKEASSSRSLPGGKNFMIGFDEHLNQIRNALATYESGLQIIPVVGMGGIGKTTLATNVYNDAYIVEHFDVRAWVSISQEYMERDIIMALLQQVYSNIEANKLSADELGNLLHKQLFGRRYFIVLDDMWDSQAWERLNLFLPDNNNGSRILVTTRLLNLAVDFKSCEPYQIGLLNDDCSWALILEQVFGKQDCPNELEDIGKSIARKCGGLPLALVVIGGLLAKSHKTREFWEYVEENVTSAANEENDEQCMKILKLSYSQLQVYLRPCFLYLAVFPKNVEIRVSRLIKLWVAEGFIKPASGRTLEEVAEGYLNDLFDRNLIMVGKRGLTGKVKICGIHDLVRDLIRREVHKNKFLCIAMLDKFSPQMKNERRLSIHIGTAQDKTCEALRSATLNRSFLSYSKWKSRRCLDRSLNLLRILDVVDFYSMEEILRLFNSRYITCDTPRESQALSSLISLLWNLQSLVVPGSLSLPSEIWQMPQLRHLKMPGITLPDPQEESDSIIVLENLQTLSTVKDFIFREQVLERIPNLKKLGIDYDTSKKIGSFCLSNLVSLDKLESLVLAFRGTWENMAFPESLKKLSLSYCKIPWEDMRVVGSLPNLEVLKLQSRAAKGQTWSLNADEFCRLKFLLIEECEMATWVADDGYFPCLEHLHLASMRMKEIPMEFAEIPTLQTIDLNYCSRSLFASAKKISKEREDFGYEEIQVRSFPSEAPQVGEMNMVGFEDEAEKLIGYLSESQEFEAIAIVGMPGLGKTTLVGKIFQDPEIQYEFPTRIWVHVSQEFTKKDIFLAILKEFTRITEDIKSKIDKELADIVVGYLHSGRFLLVMDDVWSCEDWDKLKIALPNTNKRGKVLITSRQAVLGWHVNRHKGPHKLRFLTPEESILLLQLEVFREPKFPIDLEVEGRLIAERCGGIPLAIVVIGGILVKKFSSDITTMKSTWNNFSKSFDTYLKDEDKGKHMDKIILLSYENLPHHLRECFLYFGMFPEQFEIPAWKLICLWIAEGFIQQKDDVSLEETAENYLEELINRNLVRAEKFKLDGKVKTCRVHALLRDFCLTEVGIKGGDFLQEIKMSSHGGFQPPVFNELEFRRVCIHSNALNFLSRKPYGPSVHSFVCFARDEMIMPVEDISSLPGGFKLLRVLDVEPIKFTKLSNDMYQLLHLRYLVLSVNLKVLPSGFSKLWNIQTLVVVTDSRTLDIKADLLNMIELRHFKTNASATLLKTSKSSSEGAGEKIQTLGTISPESCTEDVFDRARNLKKLSVRGKLAVLLDEKTGSFESLGNLGNLEKLKLLNDVFPVPPSGVHLRGLPPAYKFPPKLKILTLSETFLDWRHMSIIGSLENLEVLKLKDHAFMGETWKAPDGGFRHLEVLIIGRTNLKVWEASDYHFPGLKHLRLNNCEDLQQVPIGLADVPSFLKLGLFRSRRAAASARKIEEKIKFSDHNSGTDVRPFTLSIWPPEE